jgi:uncharacterized Zn finger protein (UPF0148 family)
MAGNSAALARICPTCGQPLVSGGGFCAFCGTQVSPVSEVQVTDAAIKKSIDAELSVRLKDQSTMVREIADKVEDVIWKRYTRYAIVIGLLLSGFFFFLATIGGIFTWLGYSKLSDVSSKIDPIVNEAVNKAKAAQQNVLQSASKADEIKAKTDHLSTVIDGQTKRVTDSSADIGKKMAAFDTAQKQMASSLIRSQTLSQQVDEIQKSLQTKVGQISSQVDDISLRRVYPTLGQAMYVTFNNQPWRNKQEKKPGETWVNINVEPISMGRYSPDQIEKLQAEMKQNNYLPVIGSFGVAGAYVSGYGPLTNGSGQTVIIYFDKSQEANAIALSAIASKIFSRQIPTLFVNPSNVDKADGRHIVMEQSGLDMQIYLAQ